MVDILIPTDDGPSATELRQEARLAGIPAIYRTTHERLACELALHIEEPEEVFARYGYGVDEAMALMETPAFALLLDRIAREIRESGLSFKMKARAQAEELLASSFVMATDPYVSAAVRADLIKWTAKMAGHEPREKEDGKLGGGLTLSITFAGQSPQKVVGHEPLTLEQES
ncbi:MAG: hypothetical protein ACYDBH_00580 [Acidobacteriaceae bacterium]